MSTGQPVSTSKLAVRGLVSLPIYIMVSYNGNKNELYFINTLSCCDSVVFFGREIDFLGSKWLLQRREKSIAIIYFVHLIVKVVTT